MKEKDVIEGVADGVFAFLHDRPVSVIDPAIDEVAKACAEVFKDWLNAHEEEIMLRIAGRSDSLFDGTLFVTQTTTEREDAL